MPDSKTLQLLLVEDSLVDQELLREALLEIEEHRLWCNWRSSRTVPVDRLSDSLDCLHRAAFDAVLLNLSLPDSPSLLHSFVEVSACAAAIPILVLADEPDESLANRVLREGAQDVLVKSELECVPLARAIRFAIERQRRSSAARAMAIVDPLTGFLTRDAFLKVAAYRRGEQLLGLLEVSANGENLDPLLIQAAEALRGVFEAQSVRRAPPMKSGSGTRRTPFCANCLEPPAVLGRWDRRRFCVLAPEPELRRAAAQLASGILQFSILSLHQIADGGEVSLPAKIAMLAD